MPIRFDRYRMRDGKTPLSERYFNPIWRDLDARVADLEGVNKDWRDAIAVLTAEGLRRVNEALIPAFRKVQELAELGFLSATSSTPTEFALGERALVLDEGAQRDLFSPSPFLAITRESTYEDYAIARLVSYDRETGTLALDVLAVGGTPGTYSDLVVAAVAGSAVATTAAIEATREAREAAEAAAGAAQASATGAAGAASAASGSATSAAASAATAAATTARVAAEAARDDAQAAVGGVRVTADDPVTGPLASKIVADDGIAATVEDSGGEKKLRLSLTLSFTLGDIPGTLGVAKGGTGATDASGARANLGLAIGEDVQAYHAQLAALAALASSGLIARTGTNAVAARSIAGGAGINVTNGNGVSGNPTVAVDKATAGNVHAGTADKVLTADALYPACAPVASSGSGSWAPNFSQGRVFSRTLTGNSTLANPTNQAAGQSGLVIIKQDATGGRTLSFGSNWRIAGGAPSLPTAANSFVTIFYYVESVDVILATYQYGY